MSKFLSLLANPHNNHEDAVTIIRMRRETHRDPEGRCGSRLHGGVLLSDPAGHAAPLPAPLRGGLCGWYRGQRTITNTQAQEQSGNVSRPRKNVASSFEMPLQMSQHNGCCICSYFPQPPRTTFNQQDFHLQQLAFFIHP